MSVAFLLVSWRGKDIIWISALSSFEYRSQVEATGGHNFLVTHRVAKVDIISFRFSIFGKPFSHKMYTRACELYPQCHLISEDGPDWS